jgi:hypothetical protein
MKPGIDFSWSSDTPYGLSDIEPDAASRYRAAIPDSLLRGDLLRCCIRDCKNLLPKRHRGQDHSFCPIHRISMSAKPTYVYREKRRNFIVGRGVSERIAKVENWRLGFETSEDALSWNVFVGLYALEALEAAFEALTGAIASEEPELYLWGGRIDTDGAQWSKLHEVRQALEKGLAIPTEPDIILRVPGQAVVLIEAKFGSPNGSFAGKRGRFGAVTEYLKRYKSRDGADDPLNRGWISEQEDKGILEQLCRNVIFAHWLVAGDEGPFVINLVTKHAANDEQLFRQHLNDNEVQFRVCTWEDLFDLPVIQDEKASVLRLYLKNKTRNLSPAFDL